MTDHLSKERRSSLMSHIRSVDTKPELDLRHALWHRGFRYRVNDKSQPGTPDIVLPKYQTVVFVHGCFWHGHAGCKIYHLPHTNTAFWQDKVARNQERDQDVWRQLEAKGWSVVIVWECELAKSKVDNTVERVASEILANGEMHRLHQDKRRAERDRRREERRLLDARQSALKKELNDRF